MHFKAWVSKDAAPALLWPPYNIPEWELQLSYKALGKHMTNIIDICSCPGPNQFLLNPRLNFLLKVRQPYKPELGSLTLRKNPLRGPIKIGLVQGTHKSISVGHVFARSLHTLV